MIEIAPARNKVGLPVRDYVTVPYTIYVTPDGNQESGFGPSSRVPSLLSAVDAPGADGTADIS